MGTRDPATELLAASLRGILREGKLPLLSVDMDDTFLPFGVPIGDTELDLLVDYARAGGHLAFNTLAPKEWFYLRVIERLARRVDADQCTHLLRRIHWIVSGGREIFVSGCAGHCYRRTHWSEGGSKATGLLHLLGQIEDRAAILALYGDRFDDPDNDGNAIGIDAIPLVVNVGADREVPRSGSSQVFLNAAEKGPATTLRHLQVITSMLRDAPPPGLEVEETVRQRPDRFWRFDIPSQRPEAVEVRGPGFLWSWDRRGISRLSPLLGNSGAYTAFFGDDVEGFTFFWTGGPDTASGQLPGHWEGRDFRI